MNKTGSIVDNIKRYQQLRMHVDKPFCKQLQSLMSWKIDNSLASYQVLADTPANTALLDYYFRDIFSGIDLSELKNADGVVKVIERFFSGTEMLEIAMAFNALTGEINQRVAETLFEELSVESLDEERYIQACHNAGVLDDLALQLELFEAFATDMNETLNDALVVSSVKLATVPARLAGFKKMHKIIADGFKYARAVDNAQRLAMTIINHEKQVVKNIEQRELPVFFAIQAEN